ncbi:MAG: hypothetical protein MI724_10840, partial [Spirochaetales bacterium]|nr:hypothetical protein [Spirochaetales bacterium]
MRRSSLLVSALVCRANLAAVDSDCTYTFFSDGETAVSRCTDGAGNVATVHVYDRRGEIIGEWGLMLRPPTSSIDMTFHPDGMV